MNDIYFIRGMTAAGLDRAILHFYTFYGVSIPPCFTAYAIPISFIDPSLYKEADY